MANSNASSEDIANARAFYEALRDARLNERRRLARQEAERQYQVELARINAAETECKSVHFYINI